MPRGRRRTTGRYDTREELILEVLEDYNRWCTHQSDWPLSKMAKYHGVSFGVFNNICEAKGEYLK